MNKNYKIGGIFQLIIIFIFQLSGMYIEKMVLNNQWCISTRLFAGLGIAVISIALWTFIFIKINKK